MQLGGTDILLGTRTGVILDGWALLNIECDVRAKDYWIHLHGNRRQCTYRMEKGMWQVRIHGLPVGTHLFQYLRKAIQGGSIFDFWVDTKKRLGDANVWLID